MRYESFSNNHLSLFATFVTRSANSASESKVRVECLPGPVAAGLT